MMNKMSRDFMSNFIILFLGSMGTKIITFLLVPYYTNILTTGEYGIIDIINTDVSIIALLISVGIPDAIFRFVMSRECDDEEVLKIGLLITTGLFLCACTILGIVNSFLNWPYMIYLLVLVALSVYYSIITNYIKAKQYTKYYVLIGMVQTLILVLCNVLFLSRFHWGVRGYLASVILSYLIPLAFMLFEKRIYMVCKVTFNKTLLHRMLHYGFPLIFSTVSWWIISSCDRYMLLYFYGEDKVGIYSVAARMPVILQTLIVILDTVWQISVTDIYETNKKELSVLFARFMSYFRTIGFVGCSFIMLLIKPIMAFIARNDFYEGWRYAPVLILSMIFPFSCGMASSLYKAYESNRGLMVSVVCGCFLNVILNLVLIEPFGIMGASVSTMMSRAFISLFQLKDTERFLEFDRGYKLIFLNTLILIIQSIVLINVEHNTYLHQSLFILLICFVNRKTILILIRQSKSLAYAIIKTYFQGENR